MASKRKFYRTVLKVEVLSEEPFSFNELDEVPKLVPEGNVGPPSFGREALVGCNSDNKGANHHCQRDDLYRGRNC